MISVPGAASHQSASNHSHPSGHSPATGDNAPPTIRNLIPAQNSMLDEWDLLEKSMRLRHTQEQAIRNLIPAQNSMLNEWEFLKKSVRLQRAQKQYRKKPNTEIINDSYKNENDKERICSASAESSTSRDSQENSDDGSQKTQQVFFKALRENNLSELAAIITDQNWNLNVSDPETGLTPLSLAVRNENFECVKFLLKQDVDVNARNNDGA